MSHALLFSNACKKDDTSNGYSKGKGDAQFFFFLRALLCNKIIVTLKVRAHHYNKLLNITWHFSANSMLDRKYRIIYYNITSLCASKWLVSYNRLKLQLLKATRYPLTTTGKCVANVDECLSKERQCNCGRNSNPVPCGLLAAIGPNINKYKHRQICVQTKVEAK